MLKHFDVFNKTLSESFVSRIRIACVTDNENTKALIVDCEDDVYAIGKDYDDTSVPFKLDGICKSGVCDFSYGHGHIVAVTDDGNVFAWGQNERHQCGNGGKEYVKFPTQLNFNDEKVINVSCGWDHTLALTDLGNVFAWGRNYTAQCGNGTRDNVKFPEKLFIGKVKSIACGAGHSMVMLENGQVYGWGENGDGQLGLGRETHCERSPSHLTELNGIKKLVCGTYHTIALSVKGHLFTFGYNDYGQLGIGNTERRHTPQKIESLYGGPFIDVAAVWCKEISVAFKENGKCFIWGQTNMGDWTVPTEVKCDSINDIFTLHVVSAPVTYKCYVIEGNDIKGTRNESLNFTIGKINFNARNIIGRGPTGTCVFRGLFEGKQSVAVKRLEYFEMTDHEIKSMLSLNHPNVMRYFTTERDGMFRYIASELADMTFEIYIERRRNGDFRDLNNITLLKQISEGLAYLHSQDIIHCKIRPQNAFISSPMRPKGDRKAMITDFNFSNQLISIGQVADGWTAREALQSDYTFKPTKAIDVFASGCLFYYVLNDGNHPFGDRFHRLTNVYDAKSEINALKNEESLCIHHLIEAMIADDHLKRPTMDAVLKHPLFWNSQKSLSFIGQVSNRIGRENDDSPLLNILESRAADVTKGNWMDIISDELRNDLRNRKYNGSLVKDLLRAIRNKHQHYNELLEDVKQSLGSMPDGFASYFTNNFPLLLVHIYITMQQCKTENEFTEFYCCSFDFQSLTTI